jgi:5-methylcytosine-specific restriction endonuclease McrA
MLDPRRDVARSRALVLHRLRYRALVGTRSWLDRRRRWLDAYAAVHRSEPTCAVCGAAWTLRHGHLHHRSYERLGRERFEDVTPLCRACHERVHRILASNPGWRRLGRGQASDVIVRGLRATAAKRRPDERAS